VEALVIGIATAFNFIIIKWKLEHKRFADAGLDIFIILVLSVIFSGTLGGMIVAMVASAFVIVMKANNAKLGCPKDEYGKLMKPDNFPNPEPELQKLLDSRGK